MEKQHDWLFHLNKVGICHVKVIHNHKSTVQPHEKVPCQGKKDQDMIHIKGLEEWAE